MKSLLFLLNLCLLSLVVNSQTIGSTKIEQYKASFETNVGINRYLDYDGSIILIQILKCGISEKMYEQYSQIKAKDVDLNVDNITLEYLSNLNRFTFTEDKTEIKNRMAKVNNSNQVGQAFKNSYENIWYEVDKQVTIESVTNEIKIGKLAGNRKLEFGVKNILEEYLQDKVVIVEESSSEISMSTLIIGEGGGWKTAK